MPTYSKMTEIQLRKRLQELHEQLEEREPGLVAEINLVQNYLKAFSEGPKTYADARTPREAIRLCMKLNGEGKLTKKELLNAIIEGGYMAAKPKAARGLLNDSLSHHLEYGLLVLRDDKLYFPPKGKK